MIKEADYVDMMEKDSARNSKILYRPFRGTRKDKNKPIESLNAKGIDIILQKNNNKWRCRK